METMGMLKLIFIILLFAIMALSFIYLQMSAKSKKGIKTKGEEEKNTTTKTGGSKGTYTKLSVYDFMEFDKIEDNMIVQNNGTKYLMVVECEGINYDLMSEMEKVSVEQGFIQFLNTLRHPIQIYTQTRTINIGESIDNYNKKINDIKEKLEKKKNQYTKMLQDGGYDKRDLESIRVDILREQNLLDYGKDVISNIEKMSLNKNVLRKHYYIIIPYYASEIGVQLTDEEEKRNMIFSELYTRAQAISRTLFACSMKCRVMNSNDLAQLLYVAYNRDESETYGIDKAIRAGYEELYSTAPDVLDKKMKAINKKIEERANELAKHAIDEAKSNKQKIVDKKEEDIDELVEELAAALIKENEKYIGKDVADEAINSIKKEGTKAEEVEADA